MRTIVLATGNSHKTDEVRAIVGTSFRILSLADFPDAPRPDETADSFGGNALIKAISLATWIVESGRVFPGEVAVLADDSGLEVRTLAWAPGVHSARFAALDDGRAGNSTDAENNSKLTRLLSAIPGAPRVARFRCVLAWTPLSAAGRGEEGESLRGLLARHTVFFEGTCEGRIADRASGASGFGYDPLFVPDGHSVTMAELGEGVKNRISHRARALASLLDALRQP